MKLLLVDGHYYVYRSFHAIQNELRTSTGMPTNAIYGFIKCVRKMLKDVQPDCVAVVWDEGLPVRRTQLQPEYKMNRAEMPEPMRPQLDYIRTVVPLMGIASVGLADTEADDLMASYTVAARDKGYEVVLATNDKDLFTLVNEHVRVYSTNKTDLATPKDSHALLGSEAVRKKWGVEPAQIADILALIGDSVDNIPGVPGIGPKTAVGLIAEHGSIATLLANLAAVKSEKVRAKLEEARAQIEANCEMVRLDTHHELPVALDKLCVSPKYPELIAALEKCEFKGLLAEIKAEAAQAAEAEGRVQGELAF